MKKKIILTGTEQVDLAVDILSGISGALVLNPEGAEVHQVEIKPFKKK